MCIPNVEGLIGSKYDMKNSFHGTSVEISVEMNIAFHVKTLTGTIAMFNNQTLYDRPMRVKMDSTAAKKPDIPLPGILC